MNKYEERLNNYNNVKNPNELLEFMDKNIKYGIYGTDKVVYDKWDASINSEFQKACQTKYELCGSKRLLKYGYGTCWDQVELERDWFINNDYECKTFFIWFCFSTSNNYVTHTYLVYKDKKTEKYCYFEHSDGANKGIKEFDSYKDAILYQMEKHIDFNRSVGNLINEDILSHLQVYEFEIKKYGCSQYEYMENILNSKLVYDNNKFVTEINVCKSKN